MTEQCISALHHAVVALSLSASRCSDTQNNHRRSGLCVLRRGNQQRQEKSDDEDKDFSNNAANASSFSQAQQDGRDEAVGLAYVSQASLSPFPEVMSQVNVQPQVVVQSPYIAIEGEDTEAGMLDRLAGRITQDLLDSKRSGGGEVVTCASGHGGTGKTRLLLGSLVTQLSSPLRSLSVGGDLASHSRSPNGLFGSVLTRLLAHPSVHAMAMSVVELQANVSVDLLSGAQDGHIQEAKRVHAVATSTAAASHMPSAVTTREESAGQQLQHKKEEEMKGNAGDAPSATGCFMEDWSDIPASQYVEVRTVQQAEAVLYEALQHSVSWEPADRLDHCPLRDGVAVSSSPSRPPCSSPSLSLSCPPALRPRQQEEKQSHVLVTLLIQWHSSSDVQQQQQQHQKRRHAPPLKRVSIWKLWDLAGPSTLSGYSPYASAISSTTLAARTHRALADAALLDSLLHHSRTHSPYHHSDRTARLVWSSAMKSSSLFVLLAATRYDACADVLNAETLQLAAAVGGSDVDAITDSNRSNADATAGAASSRVRMAPDAEALRRQRAARRAENAEAAECVLSNFMVPASVFLEKIARAASTEQPERLVAPDALLLSSSAAIIHDKKSTGAVKQRDMGGGAFANADARAALWPTLEEALHSAPAPAEALSINRTGDLTTISADELSCEVAGEMGGELKEGLAEGGEDEDEEQAPSPMDRVPIAYGESLPVVMTQGPLHHFSTTVQPTHRTQTHAAGEAGCHDRGIAAVADAPQDETLMKSPPPTPLAGLSGGPSTPPALLYTERPEDRRSYDPKQSQGPSEDLEDLLLAGQLFGADSSDLAEYVTNRHNEEARTSANALALLQPYMDSFAQRLEELTSSVTEWRGEEATALAQLTAAVSSNEQDLAAILVGTRRLCSRGDEAEASRLSFPLDIHSASVLRHGAEISSPGTARTGAMAKKKQAHGGGFMEAVVVPTLASDRPLQVRLRGGKRECCCLGRDETGVRSDVGPLYAVKACSVHVRQDEDEDPLVSELMRQGQKILWLEKRLIEARQQQRQQKERGSVWQSVEQRMERLLKALEALSQRCAKLHESSRRTVTQERARSSRLQKRVEELEKQLAATAQQQQRGQQSMTISSSQHFPSCSTAATAVAADAEAGDLEELPTPIHHDISFARSVTPPPYIPHSRHHGSALHREATHATTPSWNEASTTATEALPPASSTYLSREAAAAAAAAVELSRPAFQVQGVAPLAAGHDSHGTFASTTATVVQSMTDEERIASMLYRASCGSASPAAAAAAVAMFDVSVRGAAPEDDDSDMLSVPAEWVPQATPPPLMPGLSSTSLVPPQSMSPSGTTPPLSLTFSISPPHRSRLDSSAPVNVHHQSINSNGSRTSLPQSGAMVLGHGSDGEEFLSSHSFTVSRQNRDGGRRPHHYRALSEASGDAGVDMATVRTAASRVQDCALRVLSANIVQSSSSPHGAMADAAGTSELRTPTNAMKPREGEVASIYSASTLRTEQRLYDAVSSLQDATKVAERQALVASEKQREYLNAVLLS